MNLTDIEIEIKESIEKIPQESQEQGWEWKRGVWTKTIKENLCRIGKEHRFMVAASQCEDADRGEWLYDMVWYDQKGDNITNIPLVLESELNSSDSLVDDDFYKLLVARTDCRVWVFERKSKQQIVDSFKSCIDVINQFAHTQKGDRYLMLGVDWGKREFLCQLYEH